MIADMIGMKLTRTGTNGSTCYHLSVPLNQGIGSELYIFSGSLEQIAGRFSEVFPEGLRAYIYTTISPETIGEALHFPVNGELANFRLDTISNNHGYGNALNSRENIHIDSGEMGWAA